MNITPELKDIRTELETSYHKLVESNATMINYASVLDIHTELQVEHRIITGKYYDQYNFLCDCDELLDSFLQELVSLVSDHFDWCIDPILELSIHLTGKDYRELYLQVYGDTPLQNIDLTNEVKEAIEKFHLKTLESNELSTLILDLLEDCNAHSLVTAIVDP